MATEDSYKDNEESMARLSNLKLLANHSPTGVSGYTVYLQDCRFPGPLEEDAVVIKASISQP